jgi:hypothetical protein
MDSSTKVTEEFKGKLQDILGDTKRIYTTPSALKTLIIRPQEGNPLVTPQRQKQFRMGVGILLYLVKHSRPDISNLVRELSNVADGATEAHFKELLRTVKYVIDTEHLGLLLQPKFNEDGFYLE